MEKGAGVGLTFLAPGPGGARTLVLLGIRGGVGVISWKILQVYKFRIHTPNNPFMHSFYLK